jgi:hypothetical protein
VPRNLSVAGIEPNAPAAHQTVKRGMKLLTVDGIDVVNSRIPNEINAINAALFPSTLGEQHRLTFETSTGNLAVTVMASNVKLSPVPLVKTLPSAQGKIGYIQFNDHIASAQTPLVNAFKQLKQESINDLVLDLRYNGGGYLDMAAQVAYMIAPINNSNGKIFERSIFNDKNPFGFSQADSITPFHSNTIDFGQGAVGADLPNLGLNRVYILTSAQTASASEAIINGLRGVDVEVLVIGSVTRGKPYGFFPTDNCGSTYFTIQFQGVNQKAFGDFGDGFAPHCAAADDIGQAMGDPYEATLAQALYHRQYGQCNPVLSKTGSPRSGAPNKTFNADIVDRRMSTRLRAERLLSKR